MLDRWNITITNDDNTAVMTSESARISVGGGESGGGNGTMQQTQQEEQETKQQNIPFNIINNYFSIGVVSIYGI